MDPKPHKLAKITGQLVEEEEELDSVLTLGFRFLCLGIFERSFEEAARSFLRFLAYLIPQALHSLEGEGEGRIEQGGAEKESGRRGCIRV